MVAQSLKIIMYIKPKKIFEDDAFLIMRNFSYIIVVTFVFIVFIIKPDNFEF